MATIGLSIRVCTESEACEVLYVLKPSGSPVDWSWGDKEIVIPQSSSTKWRVILRPTGTRVYYNKETMKCTWHKPFELMTDSEKADDLIVWMKQETGRGRTYYYNVKTREVSFKIPEDFKKPCEQAGKEADGSGCGQIADTSHVWKKRKTERGLTYNRKTGDVSLLEIPEDFKKQAGKKADGSGCGQIYDASHVWEKRTSDCRITFYYNKQTTEVSFKILEDYKEPCEQTGKDASQGT